MGHDVDLGGCVSRMRRLEAVGDVHVREDGDPLELRDVVKALQQSRLAAAVGRAVTRDVELAVEAL